MADTFHAPSTPAQVAGSAEQARPVTVDSLVKWIVDESNLYTGLAIGPAKARKVARTVIRAADPYAAAVAKLNRPASHVAVLQAVQGADFEFGRPLTYADKTADSAVWNVLTGGAHVAQNG